MYSLNQDSWRTSLYSDYIHDNIKLTKKASRAGLSPPAPPTPDGQVWHFETCLTVCLCQKFPIYSAHSIRNYEYGWNGMNE